VTFNVGYRVDPPKWSQETQRCRISTTHGPKKVQANVINREIQKYEQSANSVLDAFEAADHVPSVAQFRESFNRVVGKMDRVPASEMNSFYVVWDKFISMMSFQNAWVPSTITKFSSLRTHLEAWSPVLSLSALSDEKLSQFVQFMLQIPLRNTTISKNVSLLHWFLRWAALRGYYKGLCHETFRPRLKGADGSSKEVIYLTWEELHLLLNFKVPPEKSYLERVRDVFCFCCFTGLRFSDVKKLSRADIRDGYLMVVTQKTYDGLKIELNDYARAILDKYAAVEFPGGLALPVISNVNTNVYLKELGELAKLSSPRRVVYFMGSVRKEEVYPLYSLLTTHCARRTFVVNALALGIPAEVVMKFTGHSDFKAMKPYVKIVDSLKEQEMAKFNRPFVVPSGEEGGPEGENPGLHES
jgi:integrase